MRRREGNPFREVARYLDTLGPAGFLLENIPGLLSANRGAALTLVRHPLRAPSSFSIRSRGSVRYDIIAQVVDMADLGVAQNREPLIVVGVRRDLGARPPITAAPAVPSPGLASSPKSRRKPYCLG
jgi:DNA (cytosine-5)-methyltransferase 1